jgi:hypothetical protein
MRRNEGEHARGRTHRACMHVHVRMHGGGFSPQLRAKKLRTPIGRRCRESALAGQLNMRRRRAGKVAMALPVARVGGRSWNAFIISKLA